MFLIHVYHVVLTQECVIDKKAGKIMFMKQSLLQKLCQINMDDKVGECHTVNVLLKKHGTSSSR